MILLSYAGVYMCTEIRELCKKTRSTKFTVEIKMSKEKTRTTKKNTRHTCENEYAADFLSTVYQ